MDVKVLPRIVATFEPDEARVLSLALGGLLKPETADYKAAQELGLKFNEMRARSMEDYVRVADGAARRAAERAS